MSYFSVHNVTQSGAALAIALQEAGGKIRSALHELRPRADAAETWVQRVIYREIEQRARTRDAAYWDRIFPDLSASERARRRIDRMLTRATVAGVAAAAGASTAEVLSLASEGSVAAAAIPLAVVSVGAEMLYTTALQIDLAFDLASIYGVPFARDDIGAISTMLAMALGVELRGEPTQHDKPSSPQDGTKPWRVIRQMQRNDFAHELGTQLLQQSVLRNAVPIVGVLVSAFWNQVVLRRFAENVHVIARRRLAIVDACRGVELANVAYARLILDGAWLIATADGALRHQEALAIANLIDTLDLPERISVREASFSDDEEEWFARLRKLDKSVEPALLEVLAIVASADGDLNVPERRFLGRLGTALHREIDFAAIERISGRLRDGAEPEPSDIAAVPIPE